MFVGTTAQRAATARETTPSCDGTLAPMPDYSARTRDGEEVHGRLAARTLEDARRTLEARGLVDIVFRTDPIASLPAPPGGEERLVAPSTPAVAVLRSFTSHGFLWVAVAVAAWLAWPHGIVAGGAALAFGLAAVAYWLMLAVPILAYARLQDAKARAAWAEARFWIGLLRATHGVLTRHPTVARAIDQDELRMWAATGQLERALAGAEALRSHDRTPTEEAGHHGFLLGLCGYAGRFEQGRDHAREAARLCPDVGAHWSELAMQEARFGDVDAAYDALARAATFERSAIAKRHEELALAWLALRAEDGPLALAATSRVVADLETPGVRTTPGYVAFARAIHAAALADMGHVDEARAFLRAARSRLVSSPDVLARAEGAIAQRAAAKAPRAAP